MLDNTHGKDSGAFRWRLLYSHHHGPYISILLGMASSHCQNNARFGLGMSNLTDTLRLLNPSCPDLQKWDNSKFSASILTMRMTVEPVHLGTVQKVE